MNIEEIKKYVGKKYEINSGLISVNIENPNEIVAFFDDIWGKQTVVRLDSRLRELSCMKKK